MQQLELTHVAEMSQKWKKDTNHI